MKTKTLFLALPLIALLLTGCQGEKKKVAAPGEPQMALSSNDTTTVRQLTTDFLEMVKAGQVDIAVNSLYVYENDEVKPLPEDRRNECRFILGMHQVYDYAIEKLYFYKEDDSEVKYRLFIQDPLTTEKPASIQGLIRPVRVDGTWYICLANSDTETKESELDKILEERQTGPKVAKPEPTPVDNDDEEEVEEEESVEEEDIEE